MAVASLDLFRRASAWTLVKIEGATTHLDDSTPCAGWDVRTLLNHMLETQRYFVASALGENDARPPAGVPDDVIGDDPTQAFAAVRDKAVRTFSAIDDDSSAGELISIAFADTLLHGWDVARATGQDERMPDGLAVEALSVMRPRLQPAQRAGTFGPELRVPDGASAQDQLLAFTGRDPSRPAT